MRWKARARRSAIRKSIICAVVPRHTTPTPCMLLKAINVNFFAFRQGRLDKLSDKQIAWQVGDSTAETIWDCRSVPEVF
jgi:hypothetical protein